MQEKTESDKQKISNTNFFSWNGLHPRHKPNIKLRLWAL